MEGDCIPARSNQGEQISIHSLRMEGDAADRPKRSAVKVFQSTPSAWRETTVTVSSPSAQNPFQSTPSAWRETQAGRAAAAREGISIHSLRMEGDCMFPCSFFFRAYFNPLPPHGGRPADRPKRSAVKVFQSTPSAWRETGTVPAVPMQRVHFNPLPPHGGRQQKHFHGAACGGFQSTPSAWRETNADDFELVIFPFQSTPSAWRETEIRCYKIAVREISIHSLRMEGDGRPGGRNSGRKPISIHSLRMEGDSKTAQESVFHFAYPCTILQKRMQKTTFCTRKNGFFRKKGEKFGAKPSASFCAPMIRTDTFPLNFSHRISGSSMSMVSFAPICSTFD